MTGELENLIDELPHASNRRVEEIAAILEGVLSGKECNSPTEDDADSAYNCLYIPKAEVMIARVRAWNENDGELKTKDRESDIKVINTLSKELKSAFNQI